MLKLKVSYEKPEELQDLLKKLGQSVRYCKLARQHGRYKRAYIEFYQILPKMK